MMLKNWIPTFVVPDKHAVRKASVKRLTSAYQALVLLSDQLPVVYRAPASVALRQMLNRIDTLFNTDVGRFFTELKASRMWLLAWLGSNKNLTRQTLKLAVTQWDANIGGFGCPILIAPLIAILISTQKEYSTSKRYWWVNRDTKPLLIMLIGVLDLSRCVVHDPKPKLDTITAPNGDCGNSKISDAEVITAVTGLCGSSADFMSDLQRETEGVKFPMPVSAGPNGKALWDAHKDAEALVADKDLFNTYCQLSKMLGFVTAYLAVGYAHRGDTAAAKGGKVSKLAYIEEKGGKTRVVAVLDYWTQYLLTPLHNVLALRLKAIPSDGTFNQEAASEKVRLMTKANNTGIYSFDLTAATDRLPSAFSARILEHLTGTTGLGALWRSVLVDRDYITPDGERVRYTVGQPMGAKTSFPMLALTHHVIVWIASARAGFSSPPLYVILGDDIVLTDSKVATQYRLIMTALHLEINEHKSIISHEPAQPAAEFCKRVFVQENEITAFPTNLVARAASDGSLAPSLHNDLVRRNTFDSVEDVVAFVCGVIPANTIDEYLEICNLPTEVSGLSVSAPSPSTGGDPAKWNPNYRLTASDVSSVWRFTVAVESLKRVDTLVRQSENLRSLLLAAEYDPSFVDRLVEDLGLSGESAATIKAALPDTVLTAGHPAIMAAYQESQRITSLLSTLNASSADVSINALNELADSFRNSIVDTMSVFAESKGPIDRTMVRRFLANIHKACDKTGPSAPHTLVFTQKISTINRVWTLYLKLGDGFHINQVGTGATLSFTSARTVVTSRRAALTMGRTTGATAT